MKKTDFAFFSSEETEFFLSETFAEQQRVDHLFPEKNGWQLTSELSAGEEGSRVLFRIYSRNGKRLVLASDYVSSHVASYSGTARAEDLSMELRQDRRKQKALDWGSLIAQIHAVDFSRLTQQHITTQASLIAAMACKLIREDLESLLKERITSDDQAAEAKDAAASYQSGLLNFLVATGKRDKKGARRADKNGLAGALGWEFLAVLRTRQFINLHAILPSKSWLRGQLENDGVSYPGQKSRDKAQWRDLFDRAGLGSLSE
jgi:hypothetical protein